MLIHVFLTATVLALLRVGEAVECPSAWAKLPDVEGDGCESYFQCEDWEPKKSWCPSGQQFSFQHKECKPDDDVWCEHQIDQYWSSHSDRHGDDDHSEEDHGDHGGSSSSGSHSSSSGGGGSGGGGSRGGGSGGSSKSSSSRSSGQGGDHHDSHTVSKSTGEHSHRSTLTKSSHSGDDWEKDYNYKYEYVSDPNYEYVYEYAYSDPWLKTQMGGSSTSSSSSSPSSSSSSPSSSSSSPSSSRSSSSKSSSSSPSSSPSRSSSSSSSSSGHGKSSCSSSKVIPFPVPVSGHSLWSGLGGLSGFGNMGSFHLGNLGSYGMLGAMREAPASAAQGDAGLRSRQGRGPKPLPVAVRPKVMEARLARQELPPEDAGAQDAGNREAEPPQDRQVQGADSTSSVNGSRERESQDRSSGTERAAPPPLLGTPSPRQPKEEEAPKADDASRAVEGEGNTAQGEPSLTPTDAGVFEAGTGTDSDGILPDEEPESPEDPGFVDQGPETAEELPPTEDNSESASLRASGSSLSDGGDANRGEFWFQEGHGDILASSTEDAMTSRGRHNLRHHVIPNPTRFDETPQSPEPEGSTQLPSVPKFLG